MGMGGSSMEREERDTRLLEEANTAYESENKPPYDPKERANYVSKFMRDAMQRDGLAE